MFKVYNPPAPAPARRSMPNATLRVINERPAGSGVRIVAVDSNGDTVTDGNLARLTADGVFRFSNVAGRLGFQTDWRGKIVISSSVGL